MKLNTKLYVVLAFGSAFYLGILFESHKKTLYEFSSQADGPVRAIEALEAAVDAPEENLEGEQEPEKPVQGEMDPLRERRRRRRAAHAEQEGHGVQNSLNQFRQSARLPKGHEFRHNPGDERPAFDELVDQFGNVTGDASALLDFAVIGFGKCGTTSMISWLEQSPELQTYPKEIYDLMFGRVREFLEKIYSMPVGDFRRGYKSPADLSVLTAVDVIREHFPRTKLVVGLRHPVLWFQSLYNFRVQNLNARANHETFPRPIDLIGRCVKKRKNTCTHKGEFGLYLRNLGKTLRFHNKRDPNTGTYDLTELEYQMYATSKTREPFPDIQNELTNPVFLFEISQLSDTNANRRDQFRQDVEQFLDLQTPLPPMVHEKPGRNWDHKEGLQQIKDAMKINICDDEHLLVRKELMRIARGASVWIRDYFLDDQVLESGGVFVSSPDYLRHLFRQWMIDPCGEEKTRKAGIQILASLPLDRKNRGKPVDSEDGIVDQ